MNNHTKNHRETAYVIIESHVLLAESIMSASFYDEQMKTMVTVF